MVQFQVTYTFASPADRDGFYSEAIARGVDVISLNEPGCHRYQYFRPCMEDHKLFLLEEWETLEHQKVHTAQPHFMELGRLKEKYSGDTELRIFNVEEVK